MRGSQWALRGMWSADVSPGTWVQARGWANVPFVAAFRDCLGPLLLIFCSLLLAPALLTQGLLKWLAVPVNYIQVLPRLCLMPELAQRCIASCFSKELLLCPGLDLVDVARTFPPPLFWNYTRRTF